MKTLVTMPFNLIALAALFGCAGCSRSGTAVGESSYQTTKAKVNGDTNASAATLQAVVATNNIGDKPFPTRAERDQMSDTERLSWLEQLGRVPVDANQKDWELAGRTRWWGKPLNPQEFWKGRTIWCDQTARGEAAVRGRNWPPIPYDDTTLARLYPALVRAYPTEGDTIWDQPGGLDSPKMSKGGAWTPRERAFWVQFIMTQPHPPEDMERTQFRVAERMLFQQKLVGDTRTRLTAAEITRLGEIEKKRNLEQGYPQESLTEDALLWAYILNQRQDYQRLQDAGSQTGSVEMKLFFDRLLVVTNYVTDPLTDAQVKAANAWKATYLQRLRREKVDESYINAYLKAWNLTSTQVFSAN